MTTSFYPRVAATHQNTVSCFDNGQAFNTDAVHRTAEKSQQKNGSEAKTANGTSARRSLYPQIGRKPSTASASTSYPSPHSSEERSLLSKKADQAPVSHARPGDWQNQHRDPASTKPGLANGYTLPVEDLVQRQWSPPPVPPSFVVQAAQADGELATSSSVSNAIRICAAAGETRRVLSLVQDAFNSGLPPDQSACIAAVEAIEDDAEGTNVSLEQLLALLARMRSAGISIVIPAAAAFPAAEASDAQVNAGLEVVAETVRKLPVSRREPEADGLAVLAKHAETWFSGRRQLSPSERLSHSALAPVLLLMAGIGSRSGRCEQAVADVVAAQIVKPLVAALQEHAENADEALAPWRFVCDLGCYTDTVLEDLRLKAVSGPWQQFAQKELRRQLLCRRWALWREDRGSGLLAWLAYDITASRTRVHSTGDVIGRLSEADQTAEEGHPLLLAALRQDASIGYAERRALVSLACRILAVVSTGHADEDRATGIVLLHCLSPPSMASIFAFRQFQSMFPWLQLQVDHSGVTDDKGCSVRRIGDSAAGTSA